MTLLNEVKRSYVKHVFISVDEFLVVVVNFYIFSFWIHFLANKYIGVNGRVATKIWV